MKSSYEVRARRFIAQLFDYIRDCEDTYEYLDAVERFNRHYHRHVDVSWGATRVAFITSDYVIKINRPDAIGEDMDCFGDCDREMRFYDFACYAGYGYLFAKIEPFNFHGLTFYIMPRVYGVGMKQGHAWDYLKGEEADFVNEYCSDLHNENFGFKNNHVVIIDYAASFFPEGWE